MRLRLTLLLLALLPGVAACAGGASQTQSQQIPAGIAGRLAAQSEALAQALDSGDECGAAQKADHLRDAADEAIASGAVPAEFQADLERAVTELQDEINCTPPAPKDEHGDKGKGKKKGEKKHGGTTSTGTTTGTSTGTSTGTTTGASG